MSFHGDLLRYLLLYYINSQLSITLLNEPTLIYTKITPAQNQARRRRHAATMIWLIRDRKDKDVYQPKEGPNYEGICTGFLNIVYYYLNRGFYEVVMFIYLR